MIRPSRLQNPSGVSQKSHALLGGHHSLILESSTLLPESLQAVPQCVQLTGRSIRSLLQRSDSLLEAVSFFLDLPDPSQNVLLLKGWDGDTAATGSGLPALRTTFATTATSVMFLFTSLAQSSSSSTILVKIPRPVRIMCNNTSSALKGSIVTKSPWTSPE